MKIALAQIKYKTADFSFNYENIIKNIENTDCDLIVLPRVDLASIGGKDFSYNIDCLDKEIWRLLAERISHIISIVLIKK